MSQYIVHCESRGTERRELTHDIVNGVEVPHPRKIRQWDTASDNDNTTNRTASEEEYAVRNGEYVLVSRRTAEISGGLEAQLRQDLVFTKGKLFTKGKFFTKGKLVPNPRQPLPQYYEEVWRWSRNELDPDNSGEILEIINFTLQADGKYSRTGTTRPIGMGS